MIYTVDRGWTGKTIPKKKEKKKYKINQKQKNNKKEQKLQQQHSRFRNACQASCLILSFRTCLIPQVNTSTRETDVHHRLDGQLGTDVSGVMSGNM